MYTHNNYMDLLTPVGMAFLPQLCLRQHIEGLWWLCMFCLLGILASKPRLAMAGVLSAVEDKAIVWLGLLCSSFTRMNMGTSRRSYLVPLGDSRKKSVADSNCLAARTVISVVCYVFSSCRVAPQEPTTSALILQTKPLKETPNPLIRPPSSQCCLHLWACQVSWASHQTATALPGHASSSS